MCADKYLDCLCFPFLVPWLSSSWMDARYTVAWPIYSHFVRPSDSACYPGSFIRSAFHAPLPGLLLILCCMDTCGYMRIYIPNVRLGPSALDLCLFASYTSRTPPRSSRDGGHVPICTRAIDYVHIVRMYVHVPRRARDMGQAAWDVRECGWGSDALVGESVVASVSFLLPARLLSARPSFL